MLKHATVALVLVVGIAVSAQRASGPNPYAPRKIPQQAGKSLVSYLSADDKIVEVVRISSAPFVAYPDGLSQMEAFTRMADAVAVVKVTARIAALTREGDWAQTTVTAQVLEPLKSTPGLPLVVGQAISFLEDGGALEVGTQRIVAASSWARATQEAQTYLMFFQLTQDHKIGSFGPLGTFSLQGSRLTRLTTDSRGENGQQDTARTLEEIRTYASLPKVQPW